MTLKVDSNIAGGQDQPKRIPFPYKRHTPDEDYVALVSQLPFYHLQFTRELLTTLGRDCSGMGLDIPHSIIAAPVSYWPSKHRGNYVRNYVLANLRIEARSTRHRGEQKLDKLWDTLPNEIIISIFEILHPIDLYHAMCASKGVRRFLLDRKFTFIWRNSFINHPDIPFYPDDVSAPKWVSLMFGPATCDICGENNTLVDYPLRVRNCERCLDHVQDEDILYDRVSPLIEDFIEDSNDLFTLSFESYRYDSFAYPDEVDYNSGPGYSMRQVIAAVREIREYVFNSHSGSPKTNYETFIKIAEDAKRKRTEHSRLCEKWARDICRRSEIAYIDSVPAAKVFVEKALLQRGHDLKDVKSTQDRLYFAARNGIWPRVSDLKITKSNLRKYLPQLELMTIEAKERRLVGEFLQRADSRRQIVHGQYCHVIESFFTHRATPYMPSPEKVAQLKHFEDYINDPEESAEAPCPFLSQQKILDYIHSYMRQKKQLLVNVLQETGYVLKASHAHWSHDDILGLGMSIFQCSHCQNAFIGHQEAGCHICLTDKGYRLEFCSDASCSMKSSAIGCLTLTDIYTLLHLASLDFISAKDLDALNKRFVCKKCDLVRKSGQHAYGLPSLTWRECVKHSIAVKDSRLHPSHIEFDVLSEALTESVLALEKPFPPPADLKWCCNHCYVYTKPLNKADAISHVKTIHGVRKPVMDVDFVYCHDENSPPALRVPILVGLDENANHRCLRCPNSLKLWAKKTVVRHLLDKHGIHPEDLMEDVDWKKIKAVEDNQWVQEKIACLEEARST
ncbi:hypothetical protein BDN70DRAFT_870269 [Pholiota conissans]|uniref:F-box domain-containing protein n=1 Tax=Pholiota conissans TaxID=109636 RepID=A0A9P5ZFJ2_9AGAR|nr:hypothetical protein BDN70DRAFT_870269 [Pholiota conissans]